MTAEMGFSRARMAEVPGAAWRALRMAHSASWSSRLEYVKVALLACVTELAVRWVPLVRLARLYGVTLAGGQAPDRPGPVTELPPWAVRRLRVVERFMRRWPVDGACLRQALVAGQRVRALQPELRLGVAKEATGIVAHAWIAVGGTSLDPTSGRYAELRSAAAWPETGRRRPVSAVAGGVRNRP